MNVKCFRSETGGTVILTKNFGVETCIFFPDSSAKNRNAGQIRTAVTSVEAAETFAEILPEPQLEHYLYLIPDPKAFLFDLPEQTPPPVSSGSVTVRASIQTRENHLGRINARIPVFEKLTVSADNSGVYGYPKPKALRGQPTALDALIEMHRSIYGQAFEKDPYAWLHVAENGIMTRVFGIDGTHIMFHVNNGYAFYKDRPDMASRVHDTVISDGDELRFFRIFGGMYGMDNSYLTFDRTEYSLDEKGGISLSIRRKYALNGMFIQEKWKWEPAENAVICILDAQDRIRHAEMTDSRGRACFSSEELSKLPAGSYSLTVIEYEDPRFGCGTFIAPYARLTLPLRSRPAALNTLVIR